MSNSDRSYLIEIDPKTKTINFSFETVLNDQYPKLVLMPGKKFVLQQNSTTEQHVIETCKKKSVRLHLLTDDLSEFKDLFPIMSIDTFEFPLSNFDKMDQKQMEKIKIDQLQLIAECKNIREILIFWFEGQKFKPTIIAELKKILLRHNCFIELVMMMWPSVAEIKQTLKVTFADFEVKDVKQSIVWRLTLKK